MMIPPLTSSQTAQAPRASFSIISPFMVAPLVGVLLKIATGFLWSFSGMASLGMWGITMGVAFLGTAMVRFWLGDERSWETMIVGQILGVVGAVFMIVALMF